ncbi:hypothetical protein JYU20_00605 [Bacteroidales bacterium AH-315-I05]|nr:hypothetical protein [Bacteroidales bacterium AH-315-I05]
MMKTAKEYLEQAIDEVAEVFRTNRIQRDIFSCPEILAAHMQVALQCDIMAQKLTQHHSPENLENTAILRVEFEKIERPKRDAFIRHVFEFVSKEKHLTAFEWATGTHIDIALPAYLQKAHNYNLTTCLSETGFRREEYTITTH